MFVARYIFAHLIKRNMPSASHSRHRSHSDPFSDPHSSPNPPPPPPKHASSPKQSSRSRPSTAPKHRDNIMDAVRDTVTVRTSDHPSRSRPSRSQSTAPPCVGSFHVPPLLSLLIVFLIRTHSNPSRPLPAPARRSHSDESVPPAASADKSKANARTRTAKKPSVHADVIDRLDFSGVGPSTSRFHHRSTDL